ncbi:MAG: YraN family protein [Buchananella hordeovulneris]|nr:YraN family protein [Buchananella hordeovulneris]
MAEKTDPAHRQRLGRRGEEIACRALLGQGMQLLGRNWRDGKRGELDVIAYDPAQDAVVFVEVKTRATGACGRPAGAVTKTKYLRLRSLARSWLAQQQRTFATLRIDVIEVEVIPGGPALVTHLEGVGY